MLKLLKLQSADQLRSKSVTPGDLMGAWPVAGNAGNYLPGDKQTHAQYYLDNYVHKAFPAEAFKTGELNGESVLLGINTGDGLMGFPFSIFGAINKSMSDEAVKAVAQAVWNTSATAVLQRYTTDKYGGRPDAALIAAYRDFSLACPNAQMAQWASANAGLKVFAYFLGSIVSASGINPLGVPPSYFPHALEVEF